MSKITLTERIRRLEGSMQDIFLSAYMMWHDQYLEPEDFRNQLAYIMDKCEQKETEKKDHIAYLVKKLYESNDMWSRCNESKRQLVLEIGEIRATTEKDRQETNRIISTISEERDQLYQRVVIQETALACFREAQKHDRK
jgi:hypothetical protein